MWKSSKNRATNRCGVAAATGGAVVLAGPDGGAAASAAVALEAVVSTVNPVISCGFPLSKMRNPSFQGFQRVVHSYRGPPLALLQHWSPRESETRGHSHGRGPRASQEPVPRRLRPPPAFRSTRPENDDSFP